MPLDGRTPKYRVGRVDGAPLDPSAKFLVLRLDQDDAASRIALDAYLTALDARGDRALARHLRAFFEPTTPAPSAAAPVRRDNRHNGGYDDETVRAAQRLMGDRR